MKITSLHFAKFTARDFAEFERNALKDLLDCQFSIAPIETKESTADILLKAIKALNKNGVEIHIDYTERKIDDPYLKVYWIKESNGIYRRLTGEKTFHSTLRYPLHELELFFKDLCFQFCIG